MTQFHRDDYYDYFARLFFLSRESYFVLQLFQKEYYKVFFPDYDPSRQDLWADTNRPWDHDHIVPKVWGEGEDEWSPQVRELIDSIGNMADIPFELNRSKGGNNDWSHYEQNRALLFGEGEDLLPLIQADDFKENLLKDKAAVCQLFAFVRERFYRISEPFSEMLSVLRINQELPPILQQRKDFLMSLMDTGLKGFNLYYVRDEVELEFLRENQYGWQQKWVTIGRVASGQYMPAVTIGIESYGCHPSLILEYGIRKCPDMVLDDMKPKAGWWKPGGFNPKGRLSIDSPETIKVIVSFLLEDHNLS